ncbi:MAG: MtrB/PioB family outer membrane beta-barrel protein [Bacteroidales bacterium]|nr:MtrB/PioB family outer membrane beta-barrel protein [Bacteroidales bacterium]
MMRQNDEFIDRTINPNISMVGEMPANSADAKVNTLLFNNVLNSQISKDLKSTLRYRYYDNDNDTPEIFWPQYNQEDAASVALRRRNLAYSYTKQNASEELTWRADKNLTVGGSVGWEQYDRDRRAVDVTNEFIGKVFLDARIGEDTRLRSSYQYSERTFENYDFASVAYYQYNGVGTNVTSLLMRQLDLADRDRQKANVSLEWSGIERLTITPTAGLRFDSYDTNPDNIYPNIGQGNAGELGLTKDNTWNVGIEVAYSFSPGTTLMLAYVHENFDRDLYSGQGVTNYLTPTTTGPNPARYFFSNMDENVDTYIASANIELIPDTLELKLNYAYAHGKENWSAQPYTNSSDCLAAVNSACQPFPAMKTDYQRLDAVLKYRVDPEFVTKVGLIGDVFVKLRYSWEQNQVTNWQNDWTTPYMYLVDGSMVRNIAMAAVNPNYTSHLIAASLAVKW